MEITKIRTMPSTTFKVSTGLFALLFIVVSLWARQEIQRHIALNAHQSWKYDRERELRSEYTSPLNLAGLFWLDSREHTFGFGIDNDLVLEAGNGPDRLGAFRVEPDSVVFVPFRDVDIRQEGRPITGAVVLKTDEEDSETPTILQHGRLSWWIIKRDGQLGVRVTDSERDALKAFSGIETYPFDMDWQVTAQFVPYETPQEHTYSTVIGTLRTETSPGLLIFLFRDRQFEMIPFVREEGNRLFLVFADQTNGDTTYGGGRFLYVDMPGASGTTTLDFNKAYNPPCAFTPYSTCPRPLAQNELPIRITAGEMKYTAGE